MKNVLRQVELAVAVLVMIAGGAGHAMPGLIVSGGTSATVVAGNSVTVTYTLQNIDPTNSITGVDEFLNLSHPTYSGDPADRVFGGVQQEFSITLAPAGQKGSIAKFDIIYYTQPGDGEKSFGTSTFTVQFEGRSELDVVQSPLGTTVITVDGVPEPSSLVLAGIGAFASLTWRWSRRRRA